MLPPATLDAAHRLVATLMTLLCAVSPVALGGGTITFSETAAHILFDRLAHLLAALRRRIEGTNGARIRAANAGQARPTRKTEPNPLSALARRLRTEPAWLLQALPDLAPAIAAELEAIVTDPAVAPIFEADPALLRALNPILRSLGLVLGPAEPPPGDDPVIPTPETPSGLAAELQRRQAPPNPVGWPRRVGFSPPIQAAPQPPTHAQNVAIEQQNR